MLSRSVVPAPKGALSLHQALELCNVYLEGAFRTADRDISLLLCHDAELALAQAKNANKGYPEHLKDTQYQALRRRVTAAYIDLGRLLDVQGYGDKAGIIRKKVEKWGGSVHDLGRLAQSSIPAFIVQSTNGAKTSTQPDGGSTDTSVIQNKDGRIVATVASHIFPKNIQPPSSMDVKLPEPDERLTDTPQLACCLGLLQTAHTPTEMLEPVRKWLHTTENDADEQERLHALATDVIRAFKRDELKDAKAIAEVVCLAPVLAKDPFREMLRDFYTAINQSGLLDTHRLEGLAQMIQGADSGYLDADDLVKILGLLSTRLSDTHQQSADHMRQLTLAVSRVLDAMAETQVKGLNRETLHEPLTAYLSDLKKSQDPYLVYQAAYAYQALLYVPDDETLWQGALRRTGRVIKGIAGLVSAVKGVDLDKFIDGLDSIQKGLAGASNAIEVVKDVAELAKSGQGLLESLKEGFSFNRKSAWYPALRGADTLIQRGELASFRTLVCEAPCRYNVAFQWGVCQRLGEMASNAMWDASIRRGAIAFLGEIYLNDDMWGQETSVKQWILNILMQLSSSNSGSSGGTSQLHSIAAESLLQELGNCEDVKKQALHRECRTHGIAAYPLKVSLPELRSPSLLDRVQNRPDVETNLRMLRKQRTKERGTETVYVPPQAKENAQATDDTRFSLMEKVNEFLESEQKVFLILGDSGAGKSTFSLELEFELWQAYKNKTGRIPLHINLPAIEKPEHDMIAKQLRKVEFTEPQIREMKHHRKFIIICDGYDESQQTHNLYVSNKLNESEEWNAQMIISCRSEYLGADYIDRFQPRDRNRQMDSQLFQEAVISPFSLDQVHAYIQQYVSIHQPLWRSEDYREALDLIPSLKDLVSNPFLMTLSLEVLPRMVDPGQQLSSAQVTRVGLYDHFVEQWLERNKKRIGEKKLRSQAKAAFERLSAEGFTRSGIEYLKKLAVAIYKEQDGNPVITYSQLIHEGTWKDAFFEKEYRQILLEACPLTRNGDQHRFIHRSILEYGLARAVFDPQDIKSTTAAGVPTARRRSVSSIASNESLDVGEGETSTTLQEPDRESPLMWRSFVNDHSLLQFLVERVQQEPVFKEQLLAFIEHSKKDKIWRKAAANAITILVRAGTQFNSADLRGIQIPGADLSYGAFDSAQLQGSNLKNVNLRGVWFNLTDLSGAHMSGVQFGELPYLSENNEVDSCAYSPDGKLFAVGLVGCGNVCLYTTSNWEKIQTFNGHTHDVRRVAFSPCGNQIASGCRDGTVRLWDVEKGTCQHILDHKDEVNYVAYSPQGDKIVTACDDKMVRLWTCTAGECLLKLHGHNGTVDCVAYSPNGSQIASGGGDNVVRLWDAETGACTHILFKHSDKVCDITYSPRGDRFATSSWDYTVGLWDARTGICHHVLDNPSYVYQVAYSPKGDQVAVGCHDGTVRLWDTETGLNTHSFFGHGNSVTGISYSPRGDQIASGSYDKTIRLWSISAGIPSHNASSRHKDRVTNVEFSPDGCLVASGSVDGTIRLWDVVTGSYSQFLRESFGAVYRIAFSPNGELIASLTDDDMVRLWDVKTGNCRQALTINAKFVCGVAFSPQGHLVASGSSDDTVGLWDVISGECRGTLNLFEQGGWSIMFSPDGKLIACGSDSGRVYLWVVESSACKYILIGHLSKVCPVAFSPQGKQLASGSVDASIRLWNVETGDYQLSLVGHEDAVFSVVFSTRGDTLVSGSTDMTVRLWDVASGQCRAVMQDFQASVMRISWKTILDVDYLVTGSSDGSVLMWKIDYDKDQCRTRLHWGTPKRALKVERTSVQDVRGLSQLNKQLLIQRGAIGEPVDQLKEARRKVVAMASVFTKLKQPPSTVVVDGSTATVKLGQAQAADQEAQQVEGICQ